MNACIMCIRLLFRIRRRSIPSLRTRTRSLSITVCILWAMVTTVQSLNSWRMIFWRTPSVAESTEAVASSRTRMLLLFNKALPRQKSCLCPTLQFSPYSTTARSRCQHTVLLTVTHLNVVHCPYCVSYLLSPTSIPLHALYHQVDIYPMPE